MSRVFICGGLICEVAALTQWFAELCSDAVGTSLGPATVLMLTSSVQIGYSLTRLLARDLPKKFSLD